MRVCNTDVIFLSSDPGVRTCLNCSGSSLLNVGIENSFSLKMV